MDDAHSSGVLEFSIDNRNYKATKLSGLQQFQLSRKLAPLMLAMAPMFTKVSENFKGTLNSSVLALAELAEPFADALSEMSDADAAKIFNLSLVAVKVETAPGTWMPLWIEKAERAPVMELNDISALLPVILRVIYYNLENFIHGFLIRHAEPTAVSSGVGSPVRKIG